MKKLILILLLFTGFLQAQTLQNPTYGNTTTNTLKVKTPATVISVNFLPTIESDFSIAKIDPVNLPINTATQNALNLKANDNSVVHLTGNETISGNKTFTGTVIVPTPTLSSHAATKGYVDGIASLPAGSNTQIQYNNSGAFGASANFTFNGTTASINSSGATNSTLIVGGIEFQPLALNNNWIADNLYYNGTFFKYRNTGYGSLFQNFNGQSLISNYASRTANSNVTVSDFKTVIKTDFNGSVGIGGNINSVLNSFTGAIVTVNGLNSKVGINNTNPEAALHIIENVSTQPRGMTIDNTGNYLNGGSILLRKGRAGNTPIITDDALGSVSFNARSATGVWAPADHAAVFSARASQDWSTGNNGCYYTFELTANGTVPSSIRQVMKINDTGQLKLNMYTSAGAFTGTPVGILHYTSTGDIVTPTVGQGVNIGSNGNIGFGTASPVNSSLLEISSTTKGFLPPRMTNAQRLAISSPAIGLEVYCTDSPEGSYSYKSTGWDLIGSKPYKVYTALISQSGTSAPTAIVLENTLGGSVTFNRTTAGNYTATLTGAFALNKTACFITPATGTFVHQAIRSSINDVSIVSLNNSNIATDSLLNNTTFEIRIYN